jgi:Methane oxygenase PmoA
MVTPTTTTHVLGRHVELRHGDVPLFRYVYGTDAAQVESPRPHFHPLRTLAGDEVTIFRPHDHRWHHGLSMTCANLSGENFWGGPTYVEGRGYMQLDNNGRIDHESWDVVDVAGGLPRLVERLAWTTQTGARWLEERRTIEVVELDPARGRWTLRLGFLLWNAAGRPLALGSPTTAGRPMAGYGGLFWRGPRSFLGGRILGPDGLEGPEAMGRRAPWLAFTGQHDGPDRCSTLVFVDHPENPRYPTKWFVRSEPYACVAWSFMFDEEYVLGAGEGLAFRHLLVVATGDPTRERIQEHVTALLD